MLSRMMLNLHGRASLEPTITQTRADNVPPSTVDFLGYRVANDSMYDFGNNDFEEESSRKMTDQNTTEGVSMFNVCHARR